MFSRRKIVRDFAKIQLIIVLSWCLPATLPRAHASSGRCRIAAVHSYEKNYRDAGRYRYLLEKELAAKGLKAEIREFFLNCNELIYEDELARASYFIDQAVEWGADAIAVFNNQAVYSLLKCGNPRLRALPVVFSGAYHPDENLIAQYPNVTGYVDIPDYARTVRMIERIVGKSRIVVMSGSNTIDGAMWRNLVGQCGRAGIETYDGDVFSHVWRHRVVRNADQEDRGEYYNEQIDTTVVMRLMSETMPLRTIQQTARGSETYLMLTARTYNSLDAPEFFVNPSFAVINEGFGSSDKMLGGYVATLETQMEDMADGIARQLRGEAPQRQITQCRKQYVLNWNVMRRYGISAENLPPQYEVMYVPLTVRYRYYILAGYIAGAGLIAALILFLTYSLSRERRRKREAVHDLLYEHETLKLAIEGGETYAWHIREGCLSFDSHFYRLIDCPPGILTLDRILDFVHPDDRERFSRNFRREERSARYRGEYRCNFGGSYQWWEFRYSSVSGDGRQPVVTGLLQNIQELKDHEAELIRARQLAERAELKQSFLNNMSHEIRTPLNAIVGFSNLLIDNPDITADERREFIHLINMNNELLLNLINDILELSRIESGSVAFALEEHDVRTLLDAYFRTFGVQMKPQLEFRCDFPAGDTTVSVDPLRLQQVVTNFLSNANKFTAAGSVVLGYRIAADRSEVRIFVKDTGKGIPSEELKLIFSRFYKHDEFAQGTGLGLSICQSIVERMHGRIEVESQEGGGSCFTVVLPLT